MKPGGVERDACLPSKAAAARWLDRKPADHPMKMMKPRDGLVNVGMRKVGSPRDGSIVNIAKILPMAFVMIAGPQILTAIVLATTEGWRRNSAAYLAGAALSITAIVTIAYFVGSGVRDAGASDDTLDIVVLVLLVAAGVYKFLTRKTAEPPKWMGKLQTADPKLSFKLGFLLLGVFPTDILTAWAVGNVSR